MAYVSNRPGESSRKLIHSNVCLLIVPVGLCVGAVALRWAMAFF